jgi:Na+-translocating ferredoxin:NAD+ oxidoreductase RnfG subunit
MVCGSFLCINANAEQLITEKEAIHKVFPGSTVTEQVDICLSAEGILRVEKEAHIVFNEGNSARVAYREVKNEEKVIGSIVVDSVQGRWGPIKFLMGVDRAGVVVGVVVLEHKEVRGKPIVKQRFLKQYLGKTSKDPVRVQKDIDGVTGATVSSRALTDGVRKDLFILKESLTSADQGACKM